jgi:hypothetical protein
LDLLPKIGVQDVVIHRHIKPPGTLEQRQARRLKSATQTQGHLGHSRSPGNVRS